MAKPRVVPRILSCQVGLRNPALVDEIKADMLAGRYDFSEPRGRIAGWCDATGTYYVNDGNHRMVAALEIYREKTDATFVLELLSWGRWEPTMRRPVGTRHMPGRSRWRSLRNWMGF